ncbi:LytR C-terminal domain-containing protein [Candidatus Pacebacteria bacterium]|nr:LytR C-terminal domain-containing protein [Candidatus Paceibacterota bacterium]
MAVIGAILALCLLPSLVLAQQSLVLSVTPTLFEMAANPGQVWQSNVKVVNTNAFDLTVYPRVVNFAPQGELGQGKLIPVFESMTDGATLAEWVTIGSEPITIPRETSREIPFIVEVPENAAPGGHFAAILISTQPPEPAAGQYMMRTAQIVSSLFFVRVAGDVVESGDIRSFATTKSIVEKPEATFELRFENKGNVHLQPRGEIIIYNMWGSERGTIPINSRTHFGNVLPESIRKFEFSWSGEQSITDIGRYRAVAALGYGEDAMQYASRSVHFWVIPVKSLLITLSVLAILFFLVSWVIKLYVRRVLEVAGVPIDRKVQREQQYSINPRGEATEDVRIVSYKSISGPMRSGYSDLKVRLLDTAGWKQKLFVFVTFVRAYWKFFVGILVVLLALVIFMYFLSDITNEDKDYSISIDNPEQPLKLSAEEIAFGELTVAVGSPTLGATEGQTYTLKLINTSGTIGTAAYEATKIISSGFGVTELTSDPSRIDKNSVIVFDAELQTTALEISQLLDGALLSALPATASSTEPAITVYIGQDRVAD